MSLYFIGISIGKVTTDIKISEANDVMNILDTIFDSEQEITKEAKV